MDEYFTRAQTYPKPFSHYASVEFTTTSGLTDYNVAAETDLFDNINIGNEILIRIYTNAATIKFNGTSEDAFTVPAGGNIQIQNFVLENIYLTAASGTSVYLLMLGR